MSRAVRVIVAHDDKEDEEFDIACPVVGIDASTVYAAARQRAGAPALLLYRERFAALVHRYEFLYAGEELTALAYEEKRDGFVQIRWALTGEWLVDVQCLGIKSSESLLVHATHAMGTRRLCSAALIWRGCRLDRRRGFVPAGETVLVYRLPEDECSTMEAILRGTLGHFSALPPELRESRGVLTELARSRAYGGGFSSLPEANRRDLRLIREASDADADPLRFVPEELRSDPSVVARCVRAAPMTIGNASEELRCDRRLALLAVQGCGFALELLPEHLRRDRELALAALRRDPMAARVLEGELLRDWSFMRQVARQSRQVRKHVDERLKCEPGVFRRPCITSLSRSDL